MVSLQTPLCEFGKPAVDFALPGVDGKVWTLEDCRGDKGLLVMFICNHCPYVKAVRDRIVRDARERGYTATDTISRWESVRRGEKRYIFPYQENADVMFNSALVYELAGLNTLAEPLLRQVPHGTPEYIEAKRLLAFLEWFLPLDIDLIPENSIAREFLGGSILKNFKLWKDNTN